MKSMSRSWWSEARNAPTIIVVVVLAVLVIGMGVLFTSAHNTEKQCTPYTVSQGETLSEIAERHAPHGEHFDNYMVEIQVANNLSTNQVHAGQKLKLPGTC